MNLWGYIAALFLLIGAMAGLWFHGNYHGKKTERLKTAEAVLDAQIEAREQERKNQEKINAIIQTQYDEVSAINDRLNADLDGLRKRASRAEMPKTTRVQSQGCTGASLPAEDASFLARESARADKLRTALMACYSYADSLQ